MAEISRSTASTSSTHAGGSIFFTCPPPRSPSPPSTPNSTSLTVTGTEEEEDDRSTSCSRDAFPLPSPTFFLQTTMHNKPQMSVPQRDKDANINCSGRRGASCHRQHSLRSPYGFSPPQRCKKKKRGITWKEKCKGSEQQQRCSREGHGGNRLQAIDVNGCKDYGCKVEKSNR